MASIAAETRAVVPLMQQHTALRQSAFSSLLPSGAPVSQPPGTERILTGMDGRSIALDLAFTNTSLLHS